MINFYVLILYILKLKNSSPLVNILVYIISFEAATWQGHKGKLTLHFENGFALHALKPPIDGDKPKLLWYFPFEKLRMSADDGHRLLWLDFGEDGEQV